MKTLGIFDVKIFTDNIEDNAVELIENLLSIDVFSKCKIRIMPDVHAGTGCVICFTGDIGDTVKHRQYHKTCVQFQGIGIMLDYLGFNETLDAVLKMKTLR